MAGYVVVVRYPGVLHQRLQQGALVIAGVLGNKHDKKLWRQHAKGMLVFGV